MVLRLLSWIQLVYIRVISLWQINRPPDSGLATIYLCHPLLLVVLGFVTIWYVARPSAVAIVAVVWLAGMLSGSFFWARRMAINLSAQRRLQYTAVQVGDEIEEIVKVSNGSFLPVLWAEFNDFSNIPGYSLTSVRAIDSLSVLEWRGHAICKQRGNYHFGPWELVTGDPFGIFRVTLAYNQQEDILVYPPLAAIPEQIFPKGRAQGDDRPLQIPLQAESLSAFSTRPYVPGDPLRHIHWPSSARHSTPFVKVFDPEAASTLWLVPDFDSAVQRGLGAGSTLETAIILLASLTDRFLSERLAVGLIVYAKNPKVLAPARGRAQFWLILRVLADLQASPIAFSETLAQARPLITGRDRVVAITPSLHAAWPGQLARLGGTTHHSGAEVILLDPSSFLSPNLPTPPASNTTAFVSFLASMSLPAKILSSGDIQPFNASYGELSRWEFQTLGTGRAFARNTPRPLPNETKRVLR